MPVLQPDSELGHILACSSPVLFPYERLSTSVGAPENIPSRAYTPRHGVMSFREDSTGGPDQDEANQALCTRNSPEWQRTRQCLRQVTRFLRDAVEADVPWRGNLAGLAPPCQKAFPLPRGV